MMLIGTKKYIGKELELREMPQLRVDQPNMVGLCGDIEKGSQITASGKLFLRGVVAFMGHFGFKPLVCDNTDGVNFSNPKLTHYSIKTFLPLEEPIPLDEVEWGGKKGIAAFLLRYNELMLPQ